MSEIILLVLGGIIVVISCLLSSKNEVKLELVKEVAEEQVKEYLSKEIKNINFQVDETVEEAINSSLEKTERILERISNEKIMAVNEYSDTVLSEINRNHEEVMFLYDMLNSKHDHLKHTASEIEKTTKEAEARIKEIEKENLNQVDEALQQKETTSKVESKTTTKLSNKIQNKTQTQAKAKVKARENQAQVLEEITSTLNQVKFSQADIDQFAMNKEEFNSGNNNDIIMKLYHEGKASVAIAKELGLGVGEVDLVIGLFKGMEKR